MLTHHDGRDYEVAVSEAATEMRGKFDGWIERGRQRASNFFESLEDMRPTDYIVDTKKLGFEIREGKLFVNTGSKEFSLHRHAFNQMVAKTGILTQGVANKMFDAASQEEKWGQELLRHCLHEMFHKGKRSRVLIRTVHPASVKDAGALPEIRGFVSDRFNRLDCRPIYTDFAKQAMELGCVPADPSEKYHPIYAHDIKAGFALFLPHVFEPIPNEVMIMGLSIQNSDFGGSMLTLRLVMIRLWCTNMAYRQDEMKRVHLGATLPDDIELSLDTYEANTRATSLAVRDVVKGLLGPKRVNMQMETIRNAAGKEVDVKAALAKLRTGGLITKDEMEKVAETYNTPEVELLPPGNNAWRLSNALSLFANNMDGGGSKERAVELRHVAGKVLDNYDAVVSE